MDGLVIRWLCMLILVCLWIVVLMHRGHAAYTETPYAIDWLFPGGSPYVSTVADNGRGLSAFNTPSGLSITLPPSSSTLPPGWHICAANDNSKTVTFNVASGHILIPKPSGGSVAVTTLALPSGNYEMVCLMADTSGGNFRIIWASPQTEISLGMLNSGGNVSGPGPGTTAGWVPGWADTTGTLLTDGYPVAGTGNNTIPETDSGGHINSAVIPVLPTSVIPDPFNGGHTGSDFTGTVGSVASGAGDCGTSPSIAGNDNVGRVTVGSSTNGGKCTVTFHTSWTNPPVCSVWNETSGARQLWPQPSQTQLVILAQSTLTAADTLAYSCREYQ